MTDMIFMSVQSYNFFACRALSTDLDRALCKARHGFASGWAYLSPSRKTPPAKPILDPTSQVNCVRLLRAKTGVEKRAF